MSTYTTTTKFLTVADLLASSLQFLSNATYSTTIVVNGVPTTRTFSTPATIGDWINTVNSLFANIAVISVPTPSIITLTAVDSSVTTIAFDTTSSTDLLRAITDASNDPSQGITTALPQSYASTEAITKQWEEVGSDKDISINSTHRILTPLQQSYVVRGFLQPTYGDTVFRVEQNNWHRPISAPAIHGRDISDATLAIEYDSCRDYIQYPNTLFPGAIIWSRYVGPHSAMSRLDAYFAPKFSCANPPTRNIVLDVSNDIQVYFTPYENVGRVFCPFNPMQPYQTSLDTVVISMNSNNSPSLCIIEPIPQQWFMDLYSQTRGLGINFPTMVSTNLNEIETSTAFSFDYGFRILLMFPNNSANNVEVECVVGPSYGDDLSTHLGLVTALTNAIQRVGLDAAISVSITSNNGIVLFTTLPSDDIVTVNLIDTNTSMKNLRTSILPQYTFYSYDSVPASLNSTDELQGLSIHIPMLPLQSPERADMYPIVDNETGAYKTPINYV